MYLSLSVCLSLSLYIYIYTHIQVYTHTHHSNKCTWMIYHSSWTWLVWAFFNIKHLAVWGRYGSKSQYSTHRQTWASQKNWKKLGLFLGRPTFSGGIHWNTTFFLLAMPLLIPTWMLIPLRYSFTCHGMLPPESWKHPATRGTFIRYDSLDL